MTISVLVPDTLYTQLYITMHIKKGNSYGIAREFSENEVKYLWVPGEFWTFFSAAQPEGARTDREHSRAEGQPTLLTLQAAACGR